ncbi:MAG: hypothetical protein HFF51_08315 [Lawsonibacter sp.]|nr:hypothetical protein [Lawsonibacter sp.]
MKKFIEDTSENILFRRIALGERVRLLKKVGASDMKLAYPRAKPKSKPSEAGSIWKGGAAQ